MTPLIPKSERVEKYREPGEKSALMHVRLTLPEPMPKPKKKLTPEQKREKKRRREAFETIFVNGKQKRVRREPQIDGQSVAEFIRRNADPVWLHQNEMWELMESGPEGDPPKHHPDGTTQDRAGEQLF